MSEQYKRRPPFLAKWLIERLSVYRDKYHINSDIEEDYEHIFFTGGGTKANLWYWKQCLHAVKFYTGMIIPGSIMMFRNYLKIALRLIGRRKGYSFINIAGLSVGMACFILILLYVRFELSYDDFHENKEHIYRLVYQQTGNYYLGSDYYCVTPVPLADIILEQYPEVENAARTTFYFNQYLLKKSDKKVYKRGLYAEHTFLEMFTLNLVYGEKESVFESLNSIIIDRETSEYFFGKRNPVGEIIKIGTDRECEITGVFENIPENSSFKFNLLLPFFSQFSESRRSSIRSNWGNQSFWTFLQLQENTEPEILEEKIQSLAQKFSDEGGNSSVVFIMQPLKEIHTQANYNFDTSEVVDRKYIMIFSAIAVLVLMIAYINYINLSIAGAAKREKEIGIRKVVGAMRGQLFRQFNSEFILYSAISVLIGISIVYFILPFFNSFVEKEISFNLSENWEFLVLITGIILASGLICGSYPSLFMSSFKPLHIIKGSLTTGITKKKMRGMFVVVQFCISIILIICGITIYEQLEFMKNRDIGYNRELVVTMWMRDSGVRSSVNVFKDKLLQNPDIITLTVSQSLPTSITSGGTVEFKDNNGKDRTVYAHTAIVDPDFLEVFEIELLEGRNFSKETGTDIRTKILVNESFVKEAGIENIWRTQFNSWNDREEVIGIVRDFNFQSMHLNIKPLVMKYRNSANRMSLRIRNKNIPDTIDFIRKTYNNYSTDYPFDYSFVDESFNRLYKFEQKLGAIFAYFSFLAVFIAGMGLFGLSLSTTESRIKEIGIRKSLGATVNSIVSLLSKEFTLFLIISNIIAFPIAYTAMDSWLGNFAYRIEIGIGILLLSSGISLLIALLSVSFQVLRSAYANPVDSLRYE